MRIGELAAATGTRTETIRYYEKEGLLTPPARTSANYRSYGEPHRQRLTFIRRARDLGFRLDDVRELLTLADDPSQPCGAVDRITTSHLDDIEAKMVDLAKMRDALRAMLRSCSQDTISDCRIIESLGPSLA
ncbi:helix-turn-helix domain-containing protein [Sphingopyxis sp. USTB-05]|uniref:MerR family transcriptional regulator n=1 Tax=Sphingopyxis sp. USTB-05 TaxID=2830667 RepID=UPI0020784FB2|nr:helix-turn-helix domain-containing protein [Sphingopyxis sp. USTB-05]USI78661.1 helix-turn-helix domain-containing protein [Sphingopyxis sp. USTB-05]